MPQSLQWQQCMDAHCLRHPQLPNGRAEVLPVAAMHAHLLCYALLQDEHSEVVTTSRTVLV